MWNVRRAKKLLQIYFNEKTVNYENALAIDSGFVTEIDDYWML